MVGVMDEHWHLNRHGGAMDGQLCLKGCSGGYGRSTGAQIDMEEVHQSHVDIAIVNTAGLSSSSLHGIFPQAKIEVHVGTKDGATG